MPVVQLIMGIRTTTLRYLVTDGMRELRKRGQQHRNVIRHHDGIQKLDEEPNFHSCQKAIVSRARTQIQP
jgi:hypothetical protein